MLCKECGREMYMESTKGWYCKCGIHTDIQGNFLYKEERKVKIPSKHTTVPIDAKDTIGRINTIGSIATIRVAEKCKV